MHTDRVIVLWLLGKKAKLACRFVLGMRWQFWFEGAWRSWNRIAVFRKDLVPGFQVKLFSASHIIGNTAEEESLGKLERSKKSLDRQDGTQRSSSSHE
jgi:hypothetical protein